MLKWTVNGPRQSYLPPITDSNPPEVYAPRATHKHERRSLNLLESRSGNTIHPTNTPAERRWLKRKSCDLNSVLRPRLLAGEHNKENQMTSTPLHAMQPSNSSLKHKPLPRLDSLQDISTIAADLTDFKHLNQQQTPQNLKKNYATTLPTFDVEYSPCGLIPGPLLALRGMGIVDAYFEKPRYITPQEDAPLDAKQAENTKTEETFCMEEAQTTLKAAALKAKANCDADYSTRMGDITLERMIDAILESNRKERKPMKSSKMTTAQRLQRAHSHVMSPTYTPADDPANDLPEYWSSVRKPSTSAHKPNAAKHLTFNEREVCSPSTHRCRESNILKLRRQRAVRRKRKISSVLSSAQKFFNVGTSSSSSSSSSNSTQVAQVAANSYQRLLDKSQHECSNKTDYRHNESNDNASVLGKNHIDCHNLSPDSGHNSSNELDEEEIDEEEQETILESSKFLHAIDMEQAKIIEATKRRLSFSPKT